MNMLLLQRLRERGSEGADLSPGDPLCAEAANEIEQLTVENRLLREAAERAILAHIRIALREPLRVAAETTTCTGCNSTPCVCEELRYAQKQRAYRIDPECWVSYSGKPKAFKQSMDRRRTESLKKAWASSAV